ncbi:MAG: CRTAC1 family protein [Pirellulales bacterium]
MRRPRRPGKTASTPGTCRWFAWLVVAGVGVGGCGPAPAPPVSRLPEPASDRAASPSVPLRFAAVADASGIQFTYRNGEEANELAFIESVGGGAALFDYDGDGRLDVFLTGGGWFAQQQVRGHPNRLYRNLGRMQFVDVTQETGLAERSFYSHGAAVSDFDRDGWPDLAVSGWGPVVLYRNEPHPAGGRQLVDVSQAAGFTEPLWGNSLAWGDLDGDGDPDLYVCQYGDWSFEKNHPTDCFEKPPQRDICAPRRFQPLPHKLFRNDGQGKFVDVSRQVGLRTDGRGLGVVIADVNADGRPDLYVANDTDENFLYINRSTDGELRLEECGFLAGVARDDRGLPSGSMGADVLDFNRTGRPALVCTNYERELNALYRNDCRDGRELFHFCSQQAGLAAVGSVWVSWGTGIADFANRGWEDLFIANGHAVRYPMGDAPRQQRPLLFWNEAGRFREVGRDCGDYFRQPHNGRGVAPGDLDNDGRVDLVVSHINAPVEVLHNVSATGFHWLGIQLQGRDRRAIEGARVTLRVGDARLTRFAKGGGSFASSPDRRLLFGLGAAEWVEEVEIAWPWGERETLPGPAVDRYWVIEEGTGQAR